MTADKRGIYVTLKGTYYSRQPGKITINMPYEIELQLTDKPEFKLPADSTILSICRSKLLPNFFEKNRADYVDYHGVRECRIEKIKTYGKKQKVKEKETPILEMTFEQLLIFVFENELNINPTASSSIDSARKLVSDAFENKKLEEKKIKEMEQEKKEREQQEFADAKEIVEFAEASAL